MSLGSGSWHSEQNASETEPMRFIQMWIMPATRGLEPSVEQKVFTKEDRTGRLLRAISGEGGDAVLVHQDASVYLSFLPAGSSVEHGLPPGSGAYLYVIEGSLQVGEEKLGTGDAAKIWDEQRFWLNAEADTELIIVEVRLDS